MERLILNFSGIYENEGYEWENTGEIWDLTHLQGTDGYLDPETEEYLRKKFRERCKNQGLPKIRILDNGNYHYMSKLLLETVKEPCYLLVFDHHTDMQPPALLPVLSCGSWVLESMEQIDLISGVCVIGPPEEAILTAKGILPRKEMDRVEFISEETLHSHQAAEKLERILKKTDESHAIYLSFDKDVLSKNVTETTWDQGIMDRGQMAELLAICGKGHQLAGLDLCGEPGRNCTKVQCAVSSEMNREIIRLMEPALSAGQD
ncbi:MAG: arginase family protein [Fusicatenibacter sp.]|nr:arginase family protein [Fusicatenibacter sp.]